MSWSICLITVTRIGHRYWPGLVIVIALGCKEPTDLTWLIRARHCFTLRFSQATLAAADVLTLVRAPPGVLPKQSHNSAHIPSAFTVFVPLVKAKPVWVFCSQLNLSFRFMSLPSCPIISSRFLLHCSAAPSYSSWHMFDLWRSFFSFP